MQGLKSNWILRVALAVMAVALASLGVLGWAYKAGALDASRISIGAFLGELDAAWPIYAVAALACLGAQIVAACMFVNLARLAKEQAPHIWRVGAFALYAVCVGFSAYSADQGATVALSHGQRAAHEARETERALIQVQIDADAALIERERALLPDPATTVTTRMQEANRTFETVTAAARARLMSARDMLEAKPSLPEMRRQSPFEAVLVFAIFLAWAILEPPGFAIAERGQTPKAVLGRQPRRTAASKGAPEPVPEPRKVIPFFRGLGEKAAALAAILFPAAALAPPPAEAAAPAVDPISHEAPAGETDDGSSEFGPLFDAEKPAAEPMNKSKVRRAPPSLPPAEAVRLADEYARTHGGHFSSHLLARAVHPSQSTIARSLMVARERGMLDDKPWARKWLRARGVR